MRAEEFVKLDSDQRAALIISMHVRNEMEEFHIQHLSDTQMKELNQIIRNAVFDAIQFGKGFEEQSKKKQYSGLMYSQFAWLVMMIPDYWEIPTLKGFKERHPKSGRKTGYHI